MKTLAFDWSSSFCPAASEAMAFGPIGQWKGSMVRGLFWRLQGATYRAFRPLRVKTRIRHVGAYVSFHRQRTRRRMSLCANCRSAAQSCFHHLRAWLANNDEELCQQTGKLVADWSAPLGPDRSSSVI